MRLVAFTFSISLPGVPESWESRSLGSLGSPGVLGVSGVPESQTVNCTFAECDFQFPFPFPGAKKPFPLTPALRFACWYLRFLQGVLSPMWSLRRDPMWSLHGGPISHLVPSWESHVVPSRGPMSHVAPSWDPMWSFSKGKIGRS